MKNAKTVVLFHDKCSDGLAAAYMALHNLGKSAKYIPVQYNKPVPVEALVAKNVYVVDFCFSLKEMRDLAESTCGRGGRLTVLDHHEGAKGVMQELKKTSQYNACEVIFNMNMSGAGLAYLYFVSRLGNSLIRKMRHNKFIENAVSFANTDVEILHRLACLVQDRDLWKWKMRDSRPLSFWLMQQELDFEMLDFLCGLKDAKIKEPFLMSVESFMDESIDEGRGVMEYHDSIIKRFAEQAREITLADVNGNFHKGLFVFCHDGKLASDLGNVLAKKSKTFGAVVSFSTTNNEFGVSLRSIGKKGFDCIQVAKAYGGGGHRNASGCRFTPGQLQEATYLINL